MEKVRFSCDGTDYEAEIPLNEEPPTHLVTSCGTKMIRIDQWTKGPPRCPVKAIEEKEDFDPTGFVVARKLAC